ncbi:VOC family protein [Streptomyces fructofermentans]|uniref:VOC domain-containing protein n=1 Tax=Streptomyces fructofermentans TaxID=152141 RepID=A0A918NIP3_9ACTN|nr:VOC family protein [Streptomyces fructofermentans]GGX76234.1 hypothetical protein GCM10010515_49900 [Streptomyces fructofermentans]
MKISSLIIRVAELERSIEFYSRVLGVEVALRDTNLVLLTSADGSQIYLHGQNSTRTTGRLGLHAATWTAESEADLLAVESRLKELEAHRRTMKHDDYMIVEGRDPDGMAVLISYPGPSDSVRRTIISAVATW